MGIFIAVIAVVIALAILVWLLVGRRAIALSEEDGGAPDEGEVLRYHAPPGQDPSYVLTSLLHHGFHARVELRGGEDVIVVARTGAAGDRAVWREEVRRAIAGADRSMLAPAQREQPVTFLDEPR